MRIELNGRKVIEADKSIYCEHCPFDINEPDFLTQLFGITDGCGETGFRYEN